MAELDIFADTTADDTTADTMNYAEAWMNALPDVESEADYSALFKDGAYYNTDGERLYMWAKPFELDPDNKHQQQFRSGQGQVRFYTEEEIRNAWNAEQGMGYFKEAYGGSVDDYIAFLDEQTGLIIDQARQEAEQAIAEGRAGTVDENTWVILNFMTGSLADRVQETDAYNSLMDQYGIPRQFVNADGDIFDWNGGSFTKTKEQNSSDFGNVLRAGVMMAASIALSGPLAGALGNTLGIGTAAANALSAAIINSTAQVVATGEIDFKQALIAAAMAGITEYLPEGADAEGIVGDILGPVNEYIGEAQSIIDSNVTNEFLNLAVKAGLGDIATQAITTGDVDFQQALIAGGTAAAMQYLKYKFGDQMTEEQVTAIEEEYGTEGEWVEENGKTFYKVDGDYYNADGTKATLEDIGVTKVTTDAEYMTALNAEGSQLNPDGSITLEDGSTLPPPPDESQVVVGTKEEDLTYAEQEQAAIDRAEYEANLVGPSEDLAAGYDPNSEFGRWMDSLDQESVLTGVTTAVDPQTGKTYIYELEGEYAVYKPEQGRPQLVNLKSGEMIPYEGTYGNPYEPGTTEYNVYEKMDPLTRHIRGGGELPGEKVTVQVEFPDGTVEEQVVEQAEQQPVEEQVVKETQEQTVTEVTDATTQEPTTTGAGPSTDSAGSPGAGTGTQIPQAIDPVLRNALLDAINRGDQQAANDIIKEIQQQEQTQEQTEQTQEQTVQPETGTDYSAEQEQVEAAQTDDGMLTGGQTASGTDSTVTQTSGDTEGQSAGSNGDMTFGGTTETTGASAGPDTGTEGQTGVVSGTPSTATPGPDVGQGGPVTIINNYGGGGGMLTGPKPVNISDFKPFRTGLSYEAPAIPETYVAPQKDYMAELDAMIQRSMFRKLG